MHYIRSNLLLALLLSLSTVLAAPLGASRTPIDLEKRRLDARQADLSSPVSFETVTTTQTAVATITETCQNTLTPNGDGTFRHDKSCTFVVTPLGQQPPDQPPPENPEQPQQPPPDQGELPPPEAGVGGETTTAELPPEATSSSEAAPPGATDTLVTSIVGGTTEGVPAPTGTDTGLTPTPSASDSAAPTGSADRGFNEIGLSSIPASDTAAAPTGSGTDGAAQPTDTPVPTGTESLVTTVTTLENGSLSTTVTTATPEAQEASVPGRKLEVLPIGLGVFAGISVIALIVVGLVTYERTKYRKAFRQRKLAETGASMGYGGMAETR